MTSSNTFSRNNKSLEPDLMSKLNTENKLFRKQYHRIQIPNLVRLQLQSPKAEVSSHLHEESLNTLCDTNHDDLPISLIKRKMILCQVSYIPICVR